MRRLVLAMVMGVWPVAAPAWAAAQDGRAPAAQEEFVPLSELDAVEQLPAAPLVIGAYAAIWVGVFVYLWTIWRRLTAVDAELAVLRRRLADKGTQDSRPA